jgi:hypothetical protein
MQPSQFLSTNPHLLRNPQWRCVLLFPTAPCTLDVYDNSSDAVAPGATIIVVTSHAKKSERVFKTAWFTKAARKTHIADQELCAAIHRLMLGQADDLGGGVFKGRLRKNQYRCIILAKPVTIGFMSIYSLSRVGPI